VKSAWNERIQHIESAVLRLKARGLAHASVEDARLSGRHIELEGFRLVNFGSCSYLGLETDARLKRAACEAVERYGVVFSSSRAYVSLPLYAEFEALLSELVGGHPVVVAPTTSLLHQAALPVLVNDGDAVCFDTMVHSSVQAVLPMLMQRGIRCEPVPHGRLDALARRVRRLSTQHARVFYLCDGVYSMHGDLANVGELATLLDHFPSLFAYVDDAHGVGWAGRHGAGIVLGEQRLHERMAVALGLAKSFATGGAVLALAQAELAQRIFTCGGPLIFTGPLQPAQLGAGIASARIHLSAELGELQTRLRARIELFDALVRGTGLWTQSRSPIRFLEVGSDEAAADLARKLLDAGYFVNVAVFPAVARGHAGVRLMLTCQQELDDVRGLAEALAHCLRQTKPVRPVAALEL